MKKRSFLLIATMTLSIQFLTAQELKRDDVDVDYFSVWPGMIFPIDLQDREEMEEKEKQLRRQKEEYDAEQEEEYWQECAKIKAEKEQDKNVFAEMQQHILNLEALRNEKARERTRKAEEAKKAVEKNP